MRLPSTSRSLARGAARLAALTVTSLALLPSAARSDEPPESPTASEVLFLYDAFPSGGRDLNASLGVERSDPDPLTGRRSLVSSPRLQVAVGLDDRLGFTAEVGLPTDGTATLQSPAASLKLLLAEPAAGATGLALSLDLVGPAGPGASTAAGLGVSAVRAVGPLALRAALSACSPLDAWTPTIHGGLSATLALDARWSVLAEVVADVSRDARTVAAGPALKVALGERAALSAGALFQVAPSPAPLFLLQLTQSI